MLYGYTGKLAEVNLTTGNITTTIPDEKTLQEYIGGRGLAAKILWDRLGTRWQSIDPLGPDNIFLALTGPVTGYIHGARICVSGKSPGSNGIVGSTASGEFPIELKCAGYDGVIVTGQAEAPVYLLITDGHVEIRDAKTLWGLDGKQTIKAINHEVRELLGNRDPSFGLWKEPGILYIGPAGENRVRTAAVMQKWVHACGYGGYGAVMGAKNLKALVAKGTGSLPDVANPEEVRAQLEQFYENAFTNQQQMRFWGTGTGGYVTGAQASAEPIRNWQEEWHDEKAFGGINFETKCWIKKYWSDYGCPVSCMKISMVKAGPLKDAITDPPDYELQAYCGPNLGIFDPEGCVYIASVIDDLGFSGINGPNSMAFAAELYQRGILTTEDLGGIEPKWGDAEAMGQLARLITERRAIGNVLAEGTYRAAKKISELKGVDVTQYAVQEKGIEIGAHGIRTGQHFPSLGYALSVQAGDHTSVPRPPSSEALAAVSDSMVYCNFTLGFGVTEPIFPFLKAVTGWNMTLEQWMNVNGRRIIQIQRAALLLGGPDIIWDPTVDDDNPPRWYTPLPNGPYKGMAANRSDLMEERKKAYAEMGWDEQGIPTRDELAKLGLQDVDRVIERLRK